LNLFDVNYNVLVTYGDNESEYLGDVLSVIADRMRRKWIHMREIVDSNKFSNSVNYCYIDDIINENRINIRPRFSIFTTCYNSYDKIIRAYKSVMNQRFIDWEWVILDDSPDEEHFKFLQKVFKDDKKVRLYKRSQNSGNIGNVKNEAVSLCRGSYVLEFDHDDEILPDCLNDAAKIFDSDPDVGFVYMDFTNIYEDGSNFSYGNFYGLGYAGYYMEKYNGKWVYVSVCPNINNVTLKHHVGMPNHPRIWRRDVLMRLGNYCEYLPICDDFEILLRTAISTKIVKLHKLAYVQYMNNNNNNFSLIRNSEINRLSPKYLIPHFFSKYSVNKKMESLNASEVNEDCPIWKRKNYVPKYSNIILNLDYDIQYCILGTEVFLNNLKNLDELYKNNKIDFILLDNKLTNDELCKFLDDNNMSRMKCYAIKDISVEEMRNYYNLIYKSCSISMIIEK
jgi:glycosyltransferase involved in cell wall biosynthesis